MEYNKRQFQKSNDKKVLHKVKKHWVVMSMALLMAIGGTAAATRVSAHADTTNNDQNQTSSTQTLKERLDSSLTQAQSHNHNIQSNANVQKNNSVQNNRQSITNQANVLHQRIIQNAAQNSNNSANNNQQSALSAPQAVQMKVQTPRINTLQGNIAKSLNVNRSNNNQIDAANGSTEANKNRLQEVNAPKVGDSSSNNNSTNGTFVIHYINTTTRNGVPANKQVGETSDSYTVNKPFHIQPYENDLPAGFELDNSNNNNKNFPTQFQPGTKDLDIFVQPIPAKGKGYIKINYINKSDGAEINSTTQSDSDGESFTYQTLEGYLKAAPTGYNIYHYGQTNNPNPNSDAGGINPKSFPMHFSSTVNQGQPNQGMQDINIEVTPIYNPMKGKAQGNIIYENSKDGDAQVSVDPFDETANSDADLTSYENDVPSGYQLTRNKSNQPEVYLQHAKWTNGDNDVIYIEPNGTDPNVPTAKPGHSFIRVQYKDVGASDGSRDNTQGQIINSINVAGTDGKDGTSDQAFNYDNYNSLLPNDYQFASDAAPKITNFPNSDGDTANAVIDVKLNGKDNPNSPKYDPSDVSNNAYSHYIIRYEDASNHHPVDATGHGYDIRVTAKTGSLINYLPYVTNLASGYKFDSMGPHADYAENSENADHPNVIYVDTVHTDAQPITVNYINQDGEQVGTSKVNGTDKTVSGQSTHNLESDVNVTTKDGSNNYGDNNSLVPAGYRVNAGEKVDHPLTNSDQTFNVLVSGNQLNAPAKFNIARVVNKNGSNKNISDYTYTTPNNAVVGQHVTVSAKDVAPAGYNTDNGQNDITEEVQADGSFKIISNNPPTAYHYTETDAAKNVQPIKVEFINQMGVNVSDADGQKSYTLNGSDGQTVNADYSNGISDGPNKGKIETPTNYHLVHGINTTYQFGDNTQTAQILVAGNSINHNNNKKHPDQPYDPNSNPAKNQINVKEVVNSDGGSHIYNKVVFADGEAGDKIQITPSSTDGNGSDLTPNGYHATSSDQDYNVTLNGDGTITAPGMDANHDITYNYTKDTGNIKIEYMYYGTAQSTKMATGEVGSQLDTSLYTNDIPNSEQGPLVVDGTLPTAPNFTEGSTPVYQIPVAPAASMSIIYKDATTGTQNAQQVGNTITIHHIANKPFSMSSPSDVKYTEFVPSGYSYDAQDGVVGAPSTWIDGDTITVYVKKNPQTPINTHTGKITVNYVDNTDDPSNTTDENPSHFVKTLNLSSDVNSVFDASTFGNLAPKGYTTDGTASGQYNINNISKYLTTPQTAYVYVKRISSAPAYSHDTIEYDDINSKTKVGSTIPITGKTGSDINYSPYESSLPSGYEFVGLGNADSKYNDGETEHILVAKPAPAYGTVNVNYYSDGVGGKSNPTKLGSDTIPAIGKNGSPFDMSTYENSLPTPSSGQTGDYYTFKSASDATDGAQKNDFIDYYNGGTQTLNVHLNRNHQISKYGTITVNYLDKNNPSSVIDSTKAVGETGDVFDVGPFEHQAPENCAFVGIKGSVPAFFPSSQNTDPSKATLNLLVDPNAND